MVANLTWLGRQEAAGASWARRSRQAWLVVITAGTIVTSYQFGIVFQRNTAWGGFSPFHIGVNDAERHATPTSIIVIKLIPQEASLAAAETIVAQVSSRKNAYSLRIAFNDADYVLARLPGRRRGSAPTSQRAQVGPLRHGVPKRGVRALPQGAPGRQSPPPFCVQLGG